MTCYTSDVWLHQPYLNWPNITNRIIAPTKI